jgi:hypothetical protein
MSTEMSGTGRASSLGLPMLARAARGSGCSASQRGSSSGCVYHSLGGNRGGSAPLLAAPVCHIRRRLELRGFPL